MTNLLHTLIILLSFWATTHIIKDSDIFNKPRIFLIRLHPFFHGLFSCYFCTGFWASLIVYLIANHYANYNVSDLLLYGLAGAATSYILNLIISKLEQ